MGVFTVIIPLADGIVFPLNKSYKISPCTDHDAGSERVYVPAFFSFSFFFVAALLGSEAHLMRAFASHVAQDEFSEGTLR